MPSMSLLETRLPNDLGSLFVGISEGASRDLPGNGGLRVWNYATLDDARTEVRAR